MIYEFDSITSFKNLLENYQQFKLLSDDLSDNTEFYRKNFNLGVLSFDLYKKMVKQSEYAVLIEIYTFS
ncbi:hypothetical protein PT071_08510, partial [Erysipelothrix rhusiopathiae]|nr:hypothetical protein [Erysipelothrix rhusiopathiae]